MSHRSRIKDKRSRQKAPVENRQHLELAGPDEPSPPPQIQPDSTPHVKLDEDSTLHATLDVIIDADTTGRALIDGNEPSLWACLTKLDPQSEVVARLKKSEIDSIPQKYRGLAYRAAVCALWTEKARKAGHLQWLIDRGIIAFPHRKTYARTIPQVLPIVDSVPGVVQVFIGALQDIVKEHLQEIDILPEQYCEADFLPPGKRAMPRGLPPKPGSQKLHVGEFYACTEQALAELFELPLKDGRLAAERAKELVPYFFIWLNAQELLQQVVTGLGEGDPYVRKKPLPDGGYSYMIDDRGPKTGR